MSHSVVSLFSGCGGLDLGFRGDFRFLDSEYSAHPFEIVWANDLNAAAVATYRRNLGEHVRVGDIWTLLPSLPSRADMVLGGFPCQDISVNGKGQGLNGKRSSLYRAMVEAVRQLSPRLFVAENVKGLLMKQHSAALDTVIGDFSDLGYDVSYDLYQAADYGVPQTRERVFIVGVAKGERPFERPLPALTQSEWITAERAIADLAALPRDERTNHIWSAAAKSPDQGQRRLRADRPGYTIRAECHGNIQFHYAQPRRISMREAARIQSFPDDFMFESRLRETERQVGNAVPPVLAWHIARACARVLSSPGRASRTGSSRSRARQLSLST